MADAQEKMSEHMMSHTYKPEETDNATERVPDDRPEKCQIDMSCGSLEVSNFSFPLKPSKTVSVMIQSNMIYKRCGSHE